MISGVILDVDGIIVGENAGYNFPDPHTDVLTALSSLRDRGIAVILCTAKPHYAIASLIEKAKLTNPHIADAGAVIIDPLAKKVIKQHIIDNDIANAVLSTLINNQIYAEFYTQDIYVVQKDTVSEITEMHSHILQKKPVKTASIMKESSRYAITKIMSIARDREDKKRIAALLNSYTSELSISWGIHPFALPLQFGIITAKGSSKKEGSMTVAKALQIPFTQMLGVGDSMSDWTFMEQCGFVATLSNGSAKLQEHIKKRKGFISNASVDENGIIDIFAHFNLL